MKLGKNRHDISAYDIKQLRELMFHFQSLPVHQVSKHNLWDDLIVLRASANYLLRWSPSRRPMSSDWRHPQVLRTIKDCKTLIVTMRAPDMIGGGRFNKAQIFYARRDKSAKELATILNNRTSSPVAADLTKSAQALIFKWKDAFRPPERIEAPPAFFSNLDLARGRINRIQPRFESDMLRAYERIQREGPATILGGEQPPHDHQSASVWVRDEQLSDWTERDESPPV